MLARLGFSVATDTEPHVLIVDEVLSVGDAAFQQKSSERMRKMIAERCIGRSGLTQSRHGPRRLRIAQSGSIVARSCRRVIRKRSSASTSGACSREPWVAAAPPRSGRVQCLRRRRVVEDTEPEEESDGAGQVPGPDTA